MHEVLKRAFELNVDPDVVQAHASREDWEGLEGACAEKVRRVNEGLKDALAPKPGHAPVPDHSELRDRLAAAETKLADHDRQQRELAAQLEEQREGLAEAMEEPEGFEEN